MYSKTTLYYKVPKRVVCLLNLVYRGKLMNHSSWLFTIIYQQIFEREIIYLIYLPLITVRVNVRFNYHTVNYQFIYQRFIYQWFIYCSVLRSSFTRGSFTSSSRDLVTQILSYMNLLHHDKQKEEILRTEIFCYSTVPLRASCVSLIGSVLS